MHRSSRTWGNNGNSKNSVFHIFSKHFSTYTQTALKHLLCQNRILAIIARFKILTQLGKQLWNKMLSVHVVFFFSISFLKMFNKIHSEIQKIVFPNVFNFHLSGFSLIHVSTLWFQQIWLNDNNIKWTINGKNVKRCNSNPVYQSCVCATCKHTDVKKKMFHYPDVNSEITFKFAMFGLYCANQPSVSEYMTVHTV